MGAHQSTQAASPAASPSASPSAQDTRTQLFRLVQGQGFELESAAAAPSFFNENEDANNKKPRWLLEVGQVEAEVTDNYSFDEQSKRVTFVTSEGIWAVKFGKTSAYKEFVHQYNSKLFENTYGVENDEANRAKIFGKDSFLTLGAETTDSRQQWAEDMDEEPGPEEVYNTTGKRVSEKDAIRGVRLGASERSYLVRDKRIDVLRNVQGGVQDTGVSFNITPSKGGAFTPNKLLLMKGERNMNMLSPEKGTSVFQADIETGKIVAEWAFQKDGVDVAMRDIINETKGAELDDRDTFLGLGSNRLVRWDQRIAGGVAQDMASPIVSYAGGKDYARNTNFSCMATSGDGYVVVGSDDGKIRLYSSNTLTMAKTSIPGLGAAITAVDVSYDGKWVLATTSKYLMVVKTTFRDKSGKETNGFTSRMGAQAPAPRLLRLKAEDQVTVARASLQKGRFTWVTQAGRQERWIVASCGNYTVLWNFRQVKLADASVQSYGGLTTVTDYHLIPKQESVVDSVFMHDNYSASPANQESSMVVVTEHQVWSLAGDDD